MKHNLSLFALVLATFVVIRGLYLTQLQHIISIFSHTTSTQTALSTEQIASLSTYHDLPIAQVKSYPTQNSWGTVIFIPQTHRSPGSSPQDLVNDSGTRSQEEIYKVLSMLTDRAGIGFVMVEGQPYGQVSAEKIALLTDKLGHRNKLIKLVGMLQNIFSKKSINASLESALLETLHRYVAKINREIILEGAAEKLVAEGKPLTLYGSENTKTVEESKPILRDLIYLQDRLQQLNSQSSKANSDNKLASHVSNLSLNSLLGKGEEKLNFEILYKQASRQGRTDITGLIDQIRTLLGEFDTQISNKIMITSSPGTPTREDNPYQTITSKNELETRLEKTKKEIDEIVVTKRNRETAQNMAQGLKKEGKILGILQFGAGHEEGLLQELNTLGLNVIVVTPNEVASRA